MLELLSTPLELSQPQHSYLGNPEKHPHAPYRAHPTQTNRAPGWCYTTSWVTWDANLWSKLAPCCSSQSHRQWPFVHTSREKGACCTGLLQEYCSLPGIPRLMAKSLLPLAPGKILIRKGVVCTFFSGLGSDAGFFSCLMQWHRYFVSLILNQAICHPGEQVSRIYSIETQRV